MTWHVELNTAIALYRAEKLEECIAHIRTVFRDNTPLCPRLRYYMLLACCLDDWYEAEDMRFHTENKHTPLGAPSILPAAFMVRIKCETTCTLISTDSPMIWEPSDRKTGRKPNTSGITSKPPRPRKSMQPSEQRKNRKRTPLPSMEKKIPVLSKRKALSLPVLRRRKVLSLPPKLKRTDCGYCRRRSGDYCSQHRARGRPCQCWCRVSQRTLRVVQSGRHGQGYTHSNCCYTY
jgi:hypothetical protein